MASTSLDQETCNKIIRQVEFYFSDSNLPKDNFLNKTITESEDGLVSLALICSFTRMRNHLGLGNVKADGVCEDTIKAVAETLRSSDFLKVSEDGKKVGRKTEMAKPEEVNSIRLPHHVVNKSFFCGTGLVEFSAAEDAEKVLKEPLVYAGADLELKPKKEFDAEREKQLQECENSQEQANQKGSEEASYPKGLIIAFTLKSKSSGSDSKRSGNPESLSEIEESKTKEVESVANVSEETDKVSKDDTNGTDSVDVNEENATGENLENEGHEVKDGEKSSEGEEKKDEENAASEGKSTLKAYKHSADVVTREDLRPVFQRFGTVKYIDFSIGAKTGYIRFEEPEASLKARAVAVLSEEGGLLVKSYVATLEPVSGEAEKEYWSKVQGSQMRYRGKGQRGRIIAAPNPRYYVDKYHIPPEYTVITQHNATVRDPPEGCIAVHECALRIGLRFPLHPFISVVLKHYGIPMCQLDPVSWYEILGFIVVARLRKLSLTMPVFNTIFRLQRVTDADEGEYFAIYPRMLVGAVLHKPNKVCDWKNSYIFIRKPWGWDLPRWVHDTASVHCFRKPSRSQDAFAAKKFLEWVKHDLEVEYEGEPSEKVVVTTPRWWIPRATYLGNEDFLRYFRLASSSSSGNVEDRLTLEMRGLVNEDAWAKTALVERVERIQARKQREHDQKLKQRRREEAFTAGGSLKRKKSIAIKFRRKELQGDDPHLGHDKGVSFKDTSNTKTQPKALTILASKDNGLLLREALGVVESDNSGEDDPPSSTLPLKKKFAASEVLKVQVVGGSGAGATNVQPTEPLRRASLSPVRETLEIQSSSVSAPSPFAKGVTTSGHSPPLTPMADAQGISSSGDEFESSPPPSPVHYGSSVRDSALRSTSTSKDCTKKELRDSFLAWVPGERFQDVSKIPDDDVSEAFLDSLMEQTSTTAAFWRRTTRDIMVARAVQGTLRAELAECQRQLSLANTAKEETERILLQREEEHETILSQKTLEARTEGYKQGYAEYRELLKSALPSFDPSKVWFSDGPFDPKSPGGKLLQWVDFLKRKKDKGSSSSHQDSGVENTTKLEGDSDGRMDHQLVVLTYNKIHKVAS